MKQGIYEQVINKLTAQQLLMLNEDEYQIGREPLNVEEARKLLSNYIATVTRRALKMVREQPGSDEALTLAQVQTCNDMIATLKHALGPEECEQLRLDEQGEILTYIYTRLNHIRSVRDEEVIRPTTPLSQSSLFTGSHYEPNMLFELKREIMTSDRIDFLISFIKWSGLRCLMDQLESFTSEGGKLRVITTTYMNASDYKAIMELSKLSNTELKISYDTKRTRLHAKAYLFYRETGFSTAYVGSSNLSNPALTSGLEWNLKVTEKDACDVLKKMEASFESYWNDREFKLFRAADETEHHKLRSALQCDHSIDSSSKIFPFDIKPYDYQKEILDKLQAEREIYGRNRNLVVAATGVGKTVVSAFDYKRFIQQKPHAKLLFVAHREEILRQSLDTFRYILKDLNFGELHVGQYQADSIDHLFISIQSMNALNLTEKISPTFYDYIVVDEFHHAAAPSYQKLLAFVQPSILLGLTATPERMDGKEILSYFGDSFAAEIRLTDAIDRKLLCPFQYFAVTDEVDLSKIKWTRKGYDLNELENVYTRNKRRVIQIIKSMEKYATDMQQVKGLGFCVGVDHAKYMAKMFNEADIPSVALHGNSTAVERHQAKTRLENGALRMIFVVDLYNEGIDIPSVNTLLFLRPTDSLTVFLQQLGRGLRLHEDKECLTVLDFIGQAHHKYRFQDKFRALTGKTRHSIKHYVQHGFFHLPRGSFIQLEKQARQYILANVQGAAITRRNLIQRMKYFESDTGFTLTLAHFLQVEAISVHEFYGGRMGQRSFYGLKAEAGLYELATPEQTRPDLVKRIPALLHLNSRRLLQFLLSYLKQGTKPATEEQQLMLQILYYTFYRTEPAKLGYSHVEEALKHIFDAESFKQEIIDIFSYTLSKLDFVSKPNEFPYTCPLEVHCTYSVDQILAAFGYWNEERAPAFREGVKYMADKKTDLFFITLNKSDKDFSPSTQYEDYAINEHLFHWQTQSRTSVESNTAQRYIHHQERGTGVALFVRAYKEENKFTAPYVFLGEAEYVQHDGNKPVNFVWRLKEEMPPAMLPAANKAII
ncbi:DUF3427 domain-containing protein [Marinicrinis sediminis]|uniref:DUF3427 domain-containing protein n=1 Tax=Marinicrinis sediminis TaxID=1652465 RepID=A0ABW5R7E5_9BACL